MSHYFCNEFICEMHPFMLDIQHIYMRTSVKKLIPVIPIQFSQLRNDESLISDQITETFPEIWEHRHSLWQVTYTFSSEKAL